MPDTDNSALEETMRRGLTDLATRAPTTLSRQAGDAGAPERHARTWSRWPLAAAAALVIAVGIPLAGSVDDQSVGPSPTPLTGRVELPAPGTWRIEAYAGVQLAVPPTWGLGGGPTTGSQIDSGLLDCGATRAFVAAGGGSSEAVKGQPFVGRPAMMTDACQPFDAKVTHPSADAVWFASPLPVGTTRYPDGQVGETVAVTGQRVTVFSRNAGLRAGIIDFVRPVVVDVNGCPADPTSHLRPSGTVEVAEPTALAVCAYGRIPSVDGAGPPVLIWSARRGARETLAYLDATRAAPPSGTKVPACSTPRQWVAVGVLDGAGSAGRWDVVDTDCGVLRTPAASSAINAEQVWPWAGAGIRAYVVGPPQPSAQVASYFRGILG